MIHDDFFIQHYHPLHQIARSFYQTFRLTGTVRMAFDVRPIADSDGNSVVEVYLTPIDAESANNMLNDQNGKHMQFLESMVPACILGFQFTVRILPEGEQDVRLDLINVAEPLAC